MNKKFNFEYIDTLLCSIANGKNDINDLDFNELISLGFIENDGTLTSNGFKRINNYKVNNVILFAAGKGSRLMPITKNTPKPLIAVFDKPIIERLIEEILNSITIENINIVVWHLKEKFQYLINKYKDQVNINLIENFEADNKNNISSFEKVKNLTSQSYVMDGDIIINGNILNQYMIKSTFFAKYCQGPSKEWMLVTDQSNNLVEVNIGGSDKHYMSGISFISNQDAKILKMLVDNAYLNPKHQSLYWEHLIVNYNDKLHFCVQGIENSDIIELDNLDELIAYDSSWSHVGYDNEALVKKIAHEIFFVTTDEILNIEPLSGGLTNKNYKFSVNGENYVMRIPQSGTNEMLDRVQEEQIYNTINGLDFCEEVIKYYPQSGIKVSKLFESTSLSVEEVNENIHLVAKTLKKMHKQKIDSTHEFNPIEELNKYIELVNKNNLKFYDNFEVVKVKIMNKYEKLLPTFEFNFCHNDLVCGNIIKLDEKIILIDWEYAGKNDIAFDIASLFSENNVSKETQNKFWENYIIEKDSNIVKRVDFWIDFQNLLWSIWHINKLGHNDIEVDDYGIKRFVKLKKYWEN